MLEGLCILLIGGDRMAVEGWALALESADAEVVWVLSGAEAMAQKDVVNPHVVVADLDHHPADAAELVGELRASTTLVAGILHQFQASGLVAPDDGGFRYMPASPVLEALCIRLEAAYRKRPVAVINLIAKPTHPLQSLADAFKIRGGDS